jgi:hypothetical protein
MVPRIAQPKPDRGALSGPLSGVSFVASLVALNALSDARYPTPGSDQAAIRRFFTREVRAARLGAAAQLTCAASLARFGVSVGRLASRAERSSHALQATAVAGAALAAISLATSALLTVALTTAKQKSTADALYRLVFATGGPIHGVGLALLVGSLGLAGSRTREMPRRLNQAALASAAAGALSPLALVGKPGLVFIPLGRLSALAVIGIAGARFARAKG